MTPPWSGNQPGSKWAILELRPPAIEGTPGEQAEGPQQAALPPVLSGRVFGMAGRKIANRSGGKARPEPVRAETEEVLQPVADSRTEPSAVPAEVENETR